MVGVKMGYDNETDIGRGYAEFRSVVSTASLTFNCGPRTAL